MPPFVGPRPIEKPEAFLLDRLEILVRYEPPVSGAIEFVQDMRAAVRQQVRVLTDRGCAVPVKDQERQLRIGLVRRDDERQITLTKPVDELTSHRRRHTHGAVVRGSRLLVLALCVQRVAQLALPRTVFLAARVCARLHG